MFARYNLSTSFDEWRSYLHSGEELFSENQAQVRRSLDRFINPDGSIDGSKLQDDWFPTIKADIFISHSHKDKELAVALSAWIKQSFNLNCFVDSTIWGYSETLLAKLKALYCHSVTSKTGYDEEKVRYASSHVDMMLATALNKMIDKTECIFFLNTSNSIIPDGISQSTASPWIYYEIVVSNSVRISVPIRHRRKLYEYAERSESKQIQDLQVIYDVDLSLFKTLYGCDLKAWKDSYKAQANPLDLLYLRTSILKRR